MAIVNFTHDHALEREDWRNPGTIVGPVWGEGAYCPVSRNLEGRYEGQDVSPRGDALIKWHTHVGLCLREREMNGYHDSDFYMLVWDDEKGEPDEIMFATTRGWTYPALASRVDATDEVKAKYEAWLQVKREERERLQRQEWLEKARTLRARLMQIAADHDLTPAQRIRFQALVRRRPPSTRDKLFGLFGKRVRSSFKLSLRQQVIEWLADENPRYSFPLSPRQMEWL